MRVDLRGRGVVPSRSLRESVRKRLAFALDPFVERIAAVRVRLGEVNGPDGRVDVECRIRVDLPDAPPVQVGAVHPELSVATTRAVDRASVAVARRLGEPERHRTGLGRKARRGARVALPPAP